MPSWSASTSCMTAASVSTLSTLPPRVALSEQPLNEHAMSSSWRPVADDVRKKIQRKKKRRKEAASKAAKKGEAAGDDDDDREDFQPTVAEEMVPLRIYHFDKKIRSVAFVPSAVGGPKPAPGSVRLAIASGNNTLDVYEAVPERDEDDERVERARFQPERRPVPDLERPRWEYDRHDEDEELPVPADAGEAPDDRDTEVCDLNADEGPVEQDNRHAEEREGQCGEGRVVDRLESGQREAVPRGEVGPRQDQRGGQEAQGDRVVLMAMPPVVGRLLEGHGDCVAEDEDGGDGNVGRSHRALPVHPLLVHSAVEHERQP